MIDRNVAIYLFSTFSAISVLVFLNASTPFVLSFLLHEPANKVASRAGTLLLADELLALPCVILFGWLLNKSLKGWASGGHLILSIALFAYSLARHTYPDLLLARLLFSLGSACATTSITTFLTVLGSKDSTQPKGNVEAEETAPLLGEAPATQSEKGPLDAPRLAGYIGLASGLGALLAVFGWLRLPTVFALHADFGAGLQRVYWLVAAISLISSALILGGMRIEQKPANQDAKFVLKKELLNLFAGFKLGYKYIDLSLAYFTALVARAQPVSVTLFIPILVNAWYIKTGHCDVDSPTATPEEIKAHCHSAFALASSLTGSVQLVSLLLAVPVGYLASRNMSPTRTPKLLALSLACGAIGFAFFGFLPNADPTQMFIVIPASLLMGFSQIFAIILSMTLCSQARDRLTDADEGEVAGSIAGTHAFFGGVGILLVSKSGSFLAGHASETLPFLVVAILDALAAIWALVAWWRLYDAGV